MAIDLRPIRSELTGRVLAIKAPIGTRVLSISPIIIVESLKMEIPVTSPWPGVIKDLWVEEGDFVTDGQYIGQLEQLKGNEP